MKAAAVNGNCNFRLAHALDRSDNWINSPMLRADLRINRTLKD
jgi:hypothetical protein